MEKNAITKEERKAYIINAFFPLFYQNTEKWYPSRFILQRCPAKADNTPVYSQAKNIELWEQMY